MSDSGKGAIKPRKTKLEEAELDITPMIDITFLLLAFFVVVSKMDPTAAVEMPRADYGEAIAEKNCVVFVVVPGDGDKFNIYKGKAIDDGQLVKEADPMEMEAEIAEYVENELSRKPEIKSIMIKAAGVVKTRIVELVRRGISRSELGKTRQMYVGVEEL